MRKIAELQWGNRNMKKRFLMSLTIVTFCLLLFSGDVNAQEYQDFKYYRDAAFSYLENNKYEEAIAMFDKAMEFNLEDDTSGWERANLLIGKGCCLAELGRYDEAMEVYDTEIAMDLDESIPYTVDAYNNKGLIFQEWGRYDDALSMYDKSIEIADGCYDCPGGYHNKGQVFTELEKYDEAIEMYNRALIEDPNFIAAYVGKSYALGLCKRYEEAIEVCDKAIELDPECLDSDISGVYLNRGWVLSMQRKNEEAMTMFEKALELNPKAYDAYAYKKTMLDDTENPNKDYDGRFVDKGIVLKNKEFTIEFNKNIDLEKAMENIFVIKNENGRIMVQDTEVKVIGNKAYIKSDEPEGYETGEYILFISNYIDADNQRIKKSIKMKFEVE